MKSIIILTLMFLLAMPFVFSAPCYMDWTARSQNPSDYVLYDEFNVAGDLNQSLWTNLTLVTVADGVVTVSGSQDSFHGVLGTDITGQPGGSTQTSNITIEMSAKAVDTGGTFITGFISFEETNCDGLTNATGCWGAEYIVGTRDGKPDLHEAAWVYAWDNALSNWGQSYTDNTWANFSLYVNTSTTINFINSTGGKSATRTGNDAWSQSPYQGYMLVNPYYTSDTATIEYIFIYNGTDCPTGIDTSSPTITSTYPLNATYYNNYDGWLNFTTNKNTNCSINRTEWVLNSTQSNSTSYKFLNKNYASLTEGLHGINISCNDAENNNGSTYLEFGIDLTAPLLTSSLQKNDTIALTTLIFQNNYSDETKVFSINITAQDYSYYEKDINTIFYSFNGTINLENYSVGSHNLTTKYCDAHTSISINEYDYDITFLTDKLTFNFDEREYSIQPKSWTHFGGVEVEKLTDRYTFNFERDKGYETTDEIFIIKSTNKISIIGDDKYTGWLVIEGINKWIDFETKEGYKATIKRINDYEVEIISQGSFFESTGDLNCVTKTFGFYKFDYSVTYNTSVSETESTTFIYTINKTGINVTSYSGNLVRDGLSYGATSQNSTNYINFTSTIEIPFVDLLITNVSFYLNFSLNSFYFNSTTNYQEVYKIFIDNCSSGNTTTALTFYSIEEVTNTSITNMDLDITLQVWRYDEALYRNYSFAFRGRSNYSICISNFTNSTEFRYNALLVYNAPLYTTKGYFITDLPMGASNEFVNLYQLNDTIASDIIFLVIDGPSGDKVSNAYIHIQRYYPGENTYKTVEIARTDENGQTIGKLVLADVFYKFLVILNQNIELDTLVQKMLSTTKTLVINTEEDELESWNRMRDVTTSVTCTNSTQTCRFQWADTTGIVQTGRLEVHRISTYGKVLLSSTSLTAASGSLVYVIPENVSGKRYLAQGFIDTTTVNSDYPIGIYELIYRADIGTLFAKGGVALLFPLMLLVVSAAAVMLEIGAIGVVFGSLVALIGGMVFGLIPLTLTAMISFVVMGGILIYKLKD